MSRRVFEYFLTLHPSEFRGEYGREMTLLFADRYRDANSASSRSFSGCKSLPGFSFTRWLFSESAIH